MNLLETDLPQQQYIVLPFLLGWLIFLLLGSITSPALVETKSTRCTVNMYWPLDKSLNASDSRPAVLLCRACGNPGSLDKEIPVAQAIEPNDDRSPQVPGLKGRKFRSIIWEWGQSPDYILELKGYFEQPFCAPRWHVIGNDSYGRSPGMECLAASKMLQQLEKRTAQAIDKVLNPPMVADVSMKNEPASLLPGGVTYVANIAQSGFKPAYEVPPDIRGLRKRSPRPRSA